MSLTESKNQYLRINTLRASSFSSLRKSLMSLLTSLVPISGRGMLSFDKISSSSENDTTALGVRFLALLKSNRFNDRFLVILQMKAEKLFGLVGGIVFHTLKYVSLTHSSESSSLRYDVP